MSSPEQQQPVQSKINLRRSFLAGFFRGLARISRLRNWSIRKICSLEGGQMHSATWRELMAKHYAVFIGPYSYGKILQPWVTPDGTRIGSYCSLAHGIEIFRRNHPTDRICQHPFFYNAETGVLTGDSIASNRDHPLTIDSDVWIGANAIITPRCQKIGLGAVIAAGAVVTKDVPPFAIMAGVPAKQIGERFPADVQQVLRDSRWWEYPINTLTPVLPLFLRAATLENARRLQEHLRTCAGSS